MLTRGGRGERVSGPTEIEGVTLRMDGRRRERREQVEVTSPTPRLSDTKSKIRRRLWRVGGAGPVWRQDEWAKGQIAKVEEWVSERRRETAVEG